MLYVKNTSPKVMGFGGLILSPGESKQLPAGYGDKHPTIQFYLGKGWLTALDTKAEAEKAAAAAKADADRIAAEKAEADRKAAEAADMLRQEEVAAKIKALSTMNLEPLRALAKELGLEVAEDDTKDALKKKITEKYQAE